jgi:hypothetical protein
MSPCSLSSRQLATIYVGSARRTDNRPRSLRRLFPQRIFGGIRKLIDTRLNGGTDQAKTVLAALNSLQVNDPPSQHFYRWSSETPPPPAVWDIDLGQLFLGN